MDFPAYIDAIVQQRHMYQVSVPPRDNHIKVSVRPKCSLETNYKVTETLSWIQEMTDTILGDHV